MGKTEGQAPPDSQSLDSIILLTASTTSDDEYLPPESRIASWTCSSSPGWGAERLLGVPGATERYKEEEE